MATGWNRAAAVVPPAEGSAGVVGTGRSNEEIAGGAVVGCGITQRSVSPAGLLWLLPQLLASCSTPASVTARRFLEAVLALIALLPGYHIESLSLSPRALQRRPASLETLPNKAELRMPFGRLHEILFRT